MRERNYEVMGKGEKEARIGLDSEKEIIDFINTDNEFEKWLRDALCVLGFFPTKRIEARKNQIKSDIILSISEQEEIGVSIKSSTKTTIWLRIKASITTKPEMDLLSGSILKFRS